MINSSPGRILHLQRLSTEDGPGIRTTVFFKGCPLHCAWCHNPESLSSRLQTQWFSVRCIDCKTCVETCPNGCLSMTADGLVIDRERCESLREMRPEPVLPGRSRRWADRDGGGSCWPNCSRTAPTIEKSGGGVTLSGGEPTFQPDFAEALLRGLKEQGISTALDTCGLCSTQHPRPAAAVHRPGALRPETARPAPARRVHRRLECADPGKSGPYSRLYPQLAARQAHPLALWIRTPLIPGATASDENLSAIGRHLAEHLDGTVSRWELCAFNNLCRDQYTRLGLEWAYAATPLMTRARTGPLRTGRQSLRLPPGPRPRHRRYKDF